MKNILMASLLVGFIGYADAVTVATPVGKIIQTQGHYVPACRLVQHKETATSVTRTFRIIDVASGHDDVSTVALAALVANRDVVINYDPAVTTGCGGDPAIQYIVVY